MLNRWKKFAGVRALGVVLAFAVLAGTVAAPAALYADEEGGAPPEEVAVAPAPTEPDSAITVSEEAPTPDVAPVADEALPGEAEVVDESLPAEAESDEVADAPEPTKAVDESALVDEATQAAAEEATQAVAEETELKTASSVAPDAVTPAAVPVTDEASLMAAIGAVTAGTSEVIEVQNSFTINSPIRFWDKDITIKSGAGGPYTITRGTFGTASDAVQETYDPPMIEANATGTGTGSITLEDIIIDDANTVGTAVGPGQRAMITAYDSRCSIILNNGAVLKNSAARQGAILLENGGTLTMNSGSSIQSWGGGAMAGYPTAIYNFKGVATIDTSISGNTIDGGVVVYNQGGDTTIGPNAQINNNNLMKTSAANDGVVIIAKDAGPGDGGYRASTTIISGEIKSNTTAGVYHNVLGTTGFNHLTITGTGDVSDNFISGTMIRPIGVFNLDAGGKMNNNQGQGHYTENSGGLLISVSRDGYTKWMNNVIAGNAAGTVYNINGQVNGNKGGGYGGVLDFAGGDTFNLGATGQVNNNTYAGNYGAFYSANAGVNTYNIYGEICGNVGKGWSGNSLAYTWSSRGVIYDQYGQINVYPGAKLNDNKNGISGGVFELTLGSQMIMYGGEMKNNSAYEGATMFTLLPTAVLSQDMDHVGGGAVHVSEASSFIMKGGEISGNQAYYGGGVLVTGGSKTRFVFEGGTIKDNIQQAPVAHSAGGGQKWSKDIGIIANGDTPILDPLNGHFVEIMPAAILGSGYIGIQNNSNQNTSGTPTLGPTVVPTASGTGYKLNQVVMVPASRTETLYIEQMDQFAPGNEGLTALRDAVSNTTTGFASGLSVYDQGKLTYAGNVWFSTDKASGAQKISTNYPDELSSANYNKYEYVFSFQALDADGVPLAGTSPTIVRPSRNGTTSLDVNVPIVAGAYGYGVVKYYYPKSTTLVLKMSHEPDAKGDFYFPANSNKDEDITFTIDTSNGNVFWSSATQTTPISVGTSGNIKLQAVLTAEGIADGYAIASIKLTAGDGSVKSYTWNASGEITLSYYDLAELTLNNENRVHAVFKTPHYDVEHYLQDFDSVGNTASNPATFTLADTDSIGELVGASVSYLDVLRTYTGYSIDLTVSGTVSSGTVLALSDVNFPLTLKLYYTLNSHNVSYGYTGAPPVAALALLPAEQTGVTYGASVTVAGNPVLAGYTFSGWTTSDAAVSAGAFSMPDTNVALTGSWTLNNYLINYVLDGGVNAAGNPTGYTVEDTFPIVISDPTRTGYAFLGWTATGGIAVTANTKNLNIPAGTVGDVTLTAHWQADPPPATYTVTYDKNTPAGADGAGVTLPSPNPVTGISAGGSATLAAPTGAPTASGGTYVFLGYDENPNTTTPTYSQTTGMTIANIQSDKTVYAIWSYTPQIDDVPLATTYTLTYEKNTPSGASGSKVKMPADVTGIAAGGSVALTAPQGVPTKSGGTYKFLGYDESKTATDPMYPASTEGMQALAKMQVDNIRSNVTVYAIWKFTKTKEIKETVAPKSDGGTTTTAAEASQPYKTGDEARPGALLVVMLAAGAVALGLAAMRRRAAGSRPYK